MDSCPPGRLARLHRLASLAIDAGRSACPGGRHLFARTLICVDVTKPDGTIIVVKAVSGSDRGGWILHGGVLLVTVGPDPAP